MRETADITRAQQSLDGVSWGSLKIWSVWQSTNQVNRKERKCKLNCPPLKSLLP